MFSRPSPVLCTVLCIASAFSLHAFAQSASLQADSEAAQSSSKSAAAYVYVSRSIGGGGANEVEAFSASTAGKLTSVSGSPFQENVENMAVNGKYLFAANKNGIVIDSYKIQSGGALKYSSSENISKSSGDCGTLGPLFFDRTGTSLYDMEIEGSGCANNTYQTFEVHQTTGSLNTLSKSSANAWLQNAASFTGNNAHAYSASCIEDSYWEIFGFERTSSGSLKAINFNGEPPSPPEGYFYCPSLTTTDQSDHVVIALQPVNNEEFTADKPARIATYTADPKGNLSTKSTKSNMAETSVGALNGIAMSPSGKLLAVAGAGGLEVLHFNGTAPLTAYTGRLTKDSIDQLAWDNDNHLYAISKKSGQLFVFTVTPESHSAASGSPHKVSDALYLAVQPE